MTRIISWGHALLAEKIKKGQLTVDLTAGNGYDTLMLHRLVGPAGQVIAFDIQRDALLSTRQRLAEEGVTTRLWEPVRRPLAVTAGVDLVHDGHEELLKYLPADVDGIIANLGYFPGGDRQIITRPETTLKAMQSACSALASGGRLAVVVYPGHPGGGLEGEVVDDFFSRLENSEFQVLQMKTPNRSDAPYLLVAEKCR